MQHREDRAHTEIRVICTQCGKLIRTVDGRGVRGDSHGLCIPCADRTLIEWERELATMHRQAAVR